MKKNRLLSGALPLVAVSLLLSCSSDEAVESKAVNGKAIAFSPVDRRLSTKAQEATTESMTDFVVLGYGSEAGNVLPNLNGVVVTRANATDDWAYAPLQEWPATGTVDFYAVSPQGAVSDLGLSAGTNAPEFDYTVPAAADQVDLLVAKAAGESATAAQPVNLTFSHALSRVQVKVTSQMDGATVRI